MSLKDLEPGDEDVGLAFRLFGRVRGKAHEPLISTTKPTFQLREKVE